MLQRDAPPPQLRIPQRPECKCEQYTVYEYDYGSEKGTILRTGKGSHTVDAAINKN